MKSLRVFPVAFFISLTIMLTIPILAKGSGQSEPSLSDVVELFKSSNPSTVAEGLQKIYQRFPLFFRGYTLSYHSRSLQTSSYLNPRAIVFGDQARFILTFNGEKSQGGFGSIELVQFSKEGEPDYREIEFPQETAQGGMNPSEIDEKFCGHGYRISKSNSLKCMACHGQERTHPLWDSYLLWPGFYGSEDDNAYRNIIEKNKVPYQSLARSMNLVGGDPEREGLLRFSQRLSAHPRYKFLKYLSVGITYTTDDVYAVSQTPPLQDSNYWDNPNGQNLRPNLHLTDRIFQMVGERYGHEVLNDPQLRDYRYLILANLGCFNAFGMGSSDLIRYIPHSLYDWHNRNSSLETIRAEEIREGMKSTLTKITHIKEDFGSFIATDRSLGLKPEVVNLLLAQQQGAYEQGLEFFPDEPNGNIFSTGLAYSQPLMDLTVLDWIARPYNLSLKLFATNREGVVDFHNGTYRGTFQMGLFSTLAASLKNAGNYSNFPSSLNKGVALDSATCRQLSVDSLEALKTIASQKH